MSLSVYHSNITKEFLLESEENVFYDRKGVFTPNGDVWFTPGKLSNSLVGMLNADGWIIALWVSNWTFENLYDLSNVKLNDFKQVVHDFITPPATITIEEIEIDWKLILLYHVSCEKERIFCRSDNEHVYLRVWDETKWPLKRDQVRKLEYDRSIRAYESEYRDDFEREDLRISVCEYYKKTIAYAWSINDLLVYRFLAKRVWDTYIINNAWILLFAENPEKYIPSASVRYLRYAGKAQTTGSSLNVVKDERFEWCIPRIIEELKRFLKTVFKDYYFLNIEIWKFMKVPEYPKEAWLEWVVNALVHRSYNLKGNVIYIKQYDDRIEISNSWPLPSIVTVENIKETRFSRNPRMARVLFEMGYVRELNEWVNRIFHSMKELFLAEPEYIDKNDIVTLTLRNSVALHKQTISEEVMEKIELLFSEFNDTQKQILKYIMTSWAWSLESIAQYIWKSEKTVRWYIQEFIALDVVVRDSEKERDKNALYSINYR